jgi:peptidyl-prolyl cis-trans isomerase C
MLRKRSLWVAGPALLLCGLSALAQPPATPPATAPATPPAKPEPLPTPAAVPVSPTAVAATVNGQAIFETQVQRGLARVLPDKHKEARPELINYLVDNMLIDQSLLQLQVAVTKEEVDKRLEEMKAELKKANRDFDKMLAELRLTEKELREHLTADMRWEKYTATQASEKVLRDFFTANKEPMFDGSMVRARHILLTVPVGDAKAGEAAQAQLLAYKKQVEDHTAAGLAKLPKATDPAGIEKSKCSLAEEAFAGIAREKSSCPSKAQGGDVNWFQRAGFMVDPFARAAFALKPGQMSDVVKTQFGYHLILVTDRKPGRDVKFEDVKDDVKELYCERLREAVVTPLRQKAQIVIHPQPK